MKNFNFSNIKKGKWTTLIGIALILGGFVDKFGFDGSWTEALVAIAAGMTLIFTNDPKKPSNNVAMLIAILVSVMLLSSCVTYQKCADKFGYQDTVKIEVRDTLYRNLSFQPPKSTYKFDMRLDSLLWAKPGQAVYFYNADSTQKVTIQKDKDNDRLSITSDCEPDTVKVEVAIPYEVEVPCPQTVLEDKPDTLKKKIVRKYSGFTMWAFPILLGIILVARWLRR